MTTDQCPEVAGSSVGPSAARPGPLVARCPVLPLVAPGLCGVLAPAAPSARRPRCAALGGGCGGVLRGCAPGLGPWACGPLALARAPSAPWGSLRGSLGLSARRLRPSPRSRRSPRGPRCGGGGSGPPAGLPRRGPRPPAWASGWVALRASAGSLRGWSPLGCSALPCLPPAPPGSPLAGPLSGRAPVGLRGRGSSRPRGAGRGAARRSPGRARPGGVGAPGRRCCPGAWGRGPGPPTSQPVKGQGPPSAAAAPPLTAWPLRRQ